MPLPTMPSMTVDHQHRCPFALEIAEVTAKMPSTRAEEPHIFTITINVMSG